MLPNILDETLQQQVCTILKRKKKKRNKKRKKPHKPKIHSVLFAAPNNLPVPKYLILRV